MPFFYDPKIVYCVLLLVLLYPPYTLISQSSTCSFHGGPAVYLHDTFNYTLLAIYKLSTIWEGLFIEIEGKHSGKNIILGSRDLRGSLNHARTRPAGPPPTLD